MPPDPILDEGEQYASSEDSDFAPDAAPDQASDHSGSEDGDDRLKRPANRQEADEAGYDNSGDEAIIKRGEKRRKRTKGKGANGDEDEGGEGGLIKTRRQRAAE
jgi:hypothetical protein